MDHERFHSLARETFGYWGYQRHLARQHDVPQTIVRRWCLGHVPIPPKVIEDLLADATNKVGTIVQLTRQRA